MNVFSTLGRTPWKGHHPDSKPLPTHGTTQHRKSQTHTSMPRVEFEPTILVFEQSKIVRALDCAATGIGNTI